MDLKSRSKIKVRGKKESILLIIPINENEIWVADERDRNLTRIDASGRFIRESADLCDENSFIYDARIHGNDILATCYLVPKVLRLSGDGETVSSFYDTSPYITMGLCVTDNQQVLVCLKRDMNVLDKEAKVVRIDSKGANLQIFSNESSDVLSFFWPDRLISLKDDVTIVVNDTSPNSLLFFNKEGKQFRKWDGYVEGNPVHIGYITHSNGKLYMTDRRAKKVYVLNTDGTGARCLIDGTKEDILLPSGITINHGQLLVGSWGGTINIFEYPQDDIRELRRRKPKETNAEMVKEEESTTPVKRRKRKLTTGKNGEQSLKEQQKKVKRGQAKQNPKKNVVEQVKDDKQIPKGTSRSFHVPAKKLDQNKSQSQVKIDIKLEESDQPVSEQYLPTTNSAEEKEFGIISKIADDLHCAGSLRLALNARDYKAVQHCATSIIQKFKQHMDEREKYLVYTAWLGYVPCENGDIAENIRIVSLTNKSCNVPLASFLGIPIRWRQFQEVSSEAEKTAYLEDIDVNIEHSEKNKVDSGELFRDHSNLTMVHVSSFKSKGFDTNEHKIEKQPCIALYCRVKGVIPIGDNPFPTSLGKLPTDVREGYCTLGAGGTLQQGVDIQCIDANKSGTIGGFVENEDGEKWFITAAHIFANITQLQEDNTTKEDRFESGNVIVHKNLQRIGKVVRGSFCYADENSDTAETSIDAAVVEIDENDISVSYNFPETDDATLDNTGYTRNHMPTICSNSLLSKPQIKENRRLQVMKYGARTKLTIGSLDIAKLDVVFHDLTLDTADVDPDTKKEKKQPFRFCGQMGVHSCTEKPFFEIGDSGAFCFMLDEHDEFSVRPFGLAIGKMSSGTCIVTPLQEVFRKLNLNEEILLPDNHQQSSSDENIETDGLKGMLEKLLDRKFKEADQKNVQNFEDVHKRLEQADQKNNQRFEDVHERFEKADQKISMIQCDVKNLKEKVNKEML